MSNQFDERNKLFGPVLSVIRPIAYLFIFLLNSCSTTTTISATNTARVPEVAKIKTVAVYPFEGRHGDIYRAEIESLLVSANLNGKRYFSVVESSKLDSVIKAQRLGAIYDESTVTKVGRLIGARGIFMGSVTTDTVADNYYRVSTQKCTYTDKNGNCKGWFNVPVFCIRRSANVGFTIRLVNVETGIQSYNRDVSGQAVSESCRGRNRSLEDREALRRRARQVAYEKVRRDVAPYTVNLNIELMDGTDGIKSGRAKQDLKSGLLFAEAGRLDRACELWREARTLAHQSIAIIYNIGVCAEAAGELDNALALYQEADRLLLKPEPIINKALSRIQNRLNRISEGL